MSVMVIEYIIKAKPIPTLHGLPSHPVGYIEGWWPGPVGERERIPLGWLRCDGKWYRRQDYPDLAAVLKPRPKWANRRVLFRWYALKEFRVPDMMVVATRPGRLREESANG